MTPPVAPLLPPSGGSPPPAMFATLRIASSGLSAQSFKMEIIAQNLANVETTRTPGGGPYQRRTVSLQPEPGTITESLASVVAGVMGNPTGAPTSGAAS